MCLSPTLVISLRNAGIARVVENTEDEGLSVQKEWILYSISLPRASYFLVVPLEDCRGNIVGKDGEKSMKEEQRGQGRTFGRMTQPKGIT